MLNTTRYYQVLGSEGEMTEEDEKKYDGVVIWYNERKGYGLSILARMKEIFLSISARFVIAVSTI